ncbi:hypothetical protein B841_08710 [Corynebacterium maris DSM 45190]|uniref:Secreted protein n=1 Tax=Corynebacterium maris DSM 45190 TaxID=1224163 RepID=S5T3J3_9CORY|nr:hypothetical protein [Corynebacterium maris]AGS35215.1 hypothetical protein B841_08710 [Corynebacterium maris DSM 45190]
MSFSRLSRRILTTTVTVALAAPLLAACADEGGDQFSDHGDALEQAVALPVDAARVNVADAGAGETRVLSYLDVDDERPDQEVTVSVSDGFDQTVMRADAVDTQAPLDAHVDTLTLPLTGVAAPADEPLEGEQEATRDVTFRLSSPEASDLDLMEDLRTTDGFRFGWRAEDTGQVSTVELAAPEDASDEGRALVEAAVMKVISSPVIFPEEEIGVGAVWSVDSRVTGDSTMLRTTTYTVTALDGDRVELDVDVQQRPALGALSLEGVAGAEDLEEQSLSVLNSNTASEGALTVDLTQPLPVDGELTFTTRVIYGGADDARIVQDTTTALEFSAGLDG